MTINVVIVTYNRLALLKKCLDSVRQQTQPINKIFIINNGSTDGTKEWLDSLNDIELIHQDNRGGAGGFYTGMKAAFEDGADWLWVMDDDVTAEPDCLEKLLRYKDNSQCLHPRKFYADKVEFPWEAFFDIDSGNAIPLDNISFKNGKDICYVNIACFEGMLIHREIIEKIGYPDERFFIAGDDTVYGFLASMHTNVAFVRDAVMHTDKISGNSYESDMYLYYYIRNHHLIAEYITRYFPYANKRTRSILFSLYLFKKFFLFSFRKRKGLKKKFRTAFIIAKAYSAYRKKETGRGYLP